jgi:heme-degrading monooxygenase HmoA
MSQRAPIQGVVVVFRSRLRADADRAAYGALADSMFEIARRLPGFIGIKDFASEDDERLALVEWRSLEELERWRHHPDHVAAQARGVREFYSEYSLQICQLVRESARESLSPGSRRA